jgi:predicted nicotinamide N-methyase
VTALFELFPASAHAEALRLRLAARFDLATHDVQVGSATFRLLKVRDTNTLLEAILPDVFAQDERLPYWADIWSSSVELARWCLEEADLRGKHILEIGCGLGLAGIAAARAGAWVTLSDYDPDALAFAEFNVATNLSPTQASRVCLLSLDWRDLPSLQPFDMIIGADVVYERSSFAALMEVLRKLLKPSGHALFTEPDRTIGADFFAMIVEHGFRISTTARPVLWDGRTNTINRVLLWNDEVS